MPVAPLPLETVGSFLEPERAGAFTDAMARAADLLSGRTVWHVNSAGEGGGVAEMLRALLSYIAAAGIDVRWLVIDAEEDFFDLTKRIHHMLHGADGGDALSDADRSVYEDTIRTNLDALTDLERGDVVILHDPQVVGLAPHLAERDCSAIWSCHIGADEPNETVRSAWEFLLPYARATSAQTFSRKAYAWEGLDPAGVSIIPPCIDPSSTKNQEFDDEVVSSILHVSGIVPNGSGGKPRFERQDGSEGTVSVRATLDEGASLPADAPMALQVSRWDPLKDPIGVLTGFAEHVPSDLGAHLVLAGPATDSVDDDPEGPEVFAEVKKAWEQLPSEARERIHLARLPMEDLEENAAIVNALQRRANVVIQKSLAEGFGLTVAEAMWKRRPTVGSRVGGIQDQIVDGENGLLVDPNDLPAYGKAVAELIGDREAAASLGEAARERVLDEYLAPRYLSRTMELVGKVLG